MKTEISHDLVRMEGGPGKIHTSTELENWFFEELAAEEQETATGRWVKRHAKARNEAFDLLVYDYAGAIAIGSESLDWDDEANLPPWAQLRVVPKKLPKIPVVAQPEPVVMTESAELDWSALGASMNG
jgi:phage terminase large subunit GpA-like protein